MRLLIAAETKIEFEKGILNDQCQSSELVPAMSDVCERNTVYSGRSLPADVENCLFSTVIV